MTPTQIIQIAIGLTTILTWIFRYSTVKQDFYQFGLNTQTMYLVGVSKILISALMVVGVWYPQITVGSTTVMAIFMAIAQYYHWKVDNSVIKKWPSAVLLTGCVWILLG
jgi:hypothetical protein